MSDEWRCVRPGEGGLVAEFSLSLAPDERLVRLNIGWVDHDRPENIKPSVLWWRDGSIAEFGVFELSR